MGSAIGSAIQENKAKWVIGEAPEYWNPLQQKKKSYTIEGGDVLSFRYNRQHNVWLMPTQDAFNRCDFSKATELAAADYGGSQDEKNPNLYEAVALSTGTLYISCQVSGHCSVGQKITIFVTPSQSDPSPPPPSPAPEGFFNMVIGILMGAFSVLFSRCGFR